MYEILRGFLINYWERVLVFMFGLGLLIGGGAVFLYTSQANFKVSHLSSNQNPDSLDLKISSSSKIFVDISGAVNEPGVFEISTTDRLIDLIVKAGGFNNHVSEVWVSKRLNLSRKLIDEEKVYIPYSYDIPQSSDIYALMEIPEPVNESSTSNKHAINDPADKVNLNTATREALISLPGVGEVTADKIILNRPYKSISELTSRSVISNSLFEKIKILITS